MLMIVIIKILISIIPRLKCQSVSQLKRLRFYEYDILFVLISPRPKKLNTTDIAHVIHFKFVNDEI